jgi:putative addiction module component (TIGR02574 family)
METVSLSEVFQMPVADRIRLVQALWDSIAQDPSKIPVTAEQRTLLERYYSEYLANPGEVLPWSEVKERLKSRK